MKLLFIMENQCTKVVNYVHMGCPLRMKTIIYCIRFLNSETIYYGFIS